MCGVCVHIIRSVSVHIMCKCSYNVVLVFI